jgi:hypothetical protein
MAGAITSGARVSHHRSELLERLTKPPLAEVGRAVALAAGLREAKPSETGRTR